jgi:mono/diheme cytochrome c family protein
MSGARFAWIALGAAVIAAPVALAQSFGSPFHFTEQGGAAIYAGVCAGCHMPDGRGAAGAGAYPALARDARLQSAGYPIAVVLHGQKAMPGFARTLSDQQIADVVGYVRTHFGNNDPDVPTAADVKAARD